MPWKHSPLPGVHVQAVEVAGQAVLVGAEGLVAAMDVNGPGAGVEDAAVAIAALNQGAGRGRHVPRALGCREGRGGERVRNGERELSSFFPSLWRCV